MKLVYTHALGACGATRAGPSPAPGTKQYMKKYFKIKNIIILITLILVGFLLYQKYWPKPAEKIYDVTQAEIKDITQLVSASGKIKSATQVNLQFQTAGLLSWVGVKEGDRVEKWQALASLDQRQLQKTLQKYLLDFSKERNNFDEAEKITYRDSLLTDSLRRILQNNQFDLTKTALDVELQNIALKYSTLITPIKGVVTKIDTPVAGVNILPAAAIFTVSDPENLIFEALIDEVDVAKIKTGQKAEITFDAYPNKPMKVIVDSLNFASQTDSSGSTVFIVKFKLTNSLEQPLLLGMNGEVNIIVATKNQVLTVPATTINETNQPTVQIIVNHQIITKNVTLGLSNGDITEITSGLNPGETIIIGKKQKK